MKFPRPSKALLAVAFTCLLGFAAEPAEAALNWNGSYTCTTKPGLFGNRREVIREHIQIVEDDDGFHGVHDWGGFMEKFRGSLLADEVRLVVDGFAAGATGRSSLLNAEGRKSFGQLVLSGERIEKVANRETQRLDCEISLLLDEPLVLLNPRTEADQAEPNDPRAAAPAATVQPPAAPLATSPQGMSETRATPETPVAVAPPAATPPARANTHRRALVLGNDTYQHVQRLLKARSDARSMAAALSRAGFEVTLRTDITERSFKEALRQFRMSVQGGDEVVVYYAGHGVQLGGANYLLPVDIRGDSEEQVKDESIPLQRILDDLSDRRAGFLLAIVDACRDNPFKSAGRAIGTRGLAPTTAASGQMVIFSAGSGQQALDTLGPQDRNPNGVFTRVLLEEMQKPELTVDRMVRSVRSKVVQIARSVGHEQIPALYDQAIGDFYLAPAQAPGSR